MKVTLGLIQMAMSDEPAKNLAKAVKHIETAASRGAHVIALPELFTSPYFPQEEKADAVKYAEAIPGDTSAALSKVAKENDVIVVGGSIFEKDGKSFYNTSMVFDEKGKMLGKYRKMHVPHDPKFYEQNYFKPGDLGYKVFDTKYGKIATLICYDQWFPEAARIVSLMDADIIFYPTAIGLIYGTEQSEGSWQDAWTTVQRGHAIANGVAVASVNRIGREGGMQFWGGSFISSQFGTLLARGGDKEQIVMAQIDLSLGKDVKEGWRFFHNRRPETYGKITEG
ncbi:MAG: carbon-nitrogen hydrolase [Candidatus ainarchaeum sp.]|nr:carbon-nitrogen hydrolase [Candidatus ainarchaeum sp.]